MKRLLQFALALLLVLPCAAQQVVQSMAQQATVSTTGPVTWADTGLQVSRDIGQTAHWLSYFTTGFPTNVSVRLEGSFTGSNWFAITDTLSGSAACCQTIQGGGYYPYVRANVLTLAGGSSPTITVYYSAAAGPIPNSLIRRNNTPAGTMATALSTVSLISNASATGAEAGSSAIPTDSLSGLLVVFFSGITGSPSGCNLSIAGQWALGQAETLQSFATTPSNGLQTFYISAPQTLAEVIFVTYSCTGFPSGGTISASFSPTTPVTGMVSANSLTAATGNGAVQTEKGPRWSINSNPAAGSQATISKAAGGTGVIHVADCVTFSAGSTTAPALTALTINLRDGATGAGTIKHTWEVVIPATAGQDVNPFSVCGLNIPGSANTAMTLEFSAGLTSLIESVSLSGYDVQ